MITTGMKLSRSSASIRNSDPVTVEIINWTDFLGNLFEVRPAAIQMVTQKHSERPVWLPLNEFAKLVYV